MSFFCNIKIENVGIKGKDLHSVVVYQKISNKVAGIDNCQALVRQLSILTIELLFSFWKIYRFQSRKKSGMHFKVNSLLHTPVF